MSTKTPIIEAHLIQLELRLKEASELARLSNSLIIEQDKLLKNATATRLQLSDLHSDLKALRDRIETTRKNFQSWNKV